MTDPPKRVASEPGRNAWFLWSLTSFLFVYPTFAWFTPERSLAYLGVYWSLDLVCLVSLVMLARKRRSKAEQ